MADLSDHDMPPTACTGIGIPRQNAFDAAAFERAVSDLLAACGIAPEMQHMGRTAERVRTLWQKRLLGGYDLDPAEALGEGFEDHRRDMVVVRGIAEHGVCPHHLVPFRGVAHVAYLPGGRLHRAAGVRRAVVDDGDRRARVSSRAPMYRKAAPKPFDERVLARWRGALHARRLVHVMRKYSWPWPASFALGAIVFGAIGVTFPVKTELVCEAEGCALRKTYLPWRTEVLPITSLSAHDTQLSDEEKGPKLPVQREGALPEWYARPDAFALAKRAGEARDGGEPLVAELAGAGAAAGFGAGGVACLGTALLLWALRTSTSTLCVMTQGRSRMR